MVGWGYRHGSSRWDKATLLQLLEDCSVAFGVYLAVALVAVGTAVCIAAAPDQGAVETAGASIHILVRVFRFLGPLRGTFVAQGAVALICGYAGACVAVVTALRARYVAAGGVSVLHGAS